MYLSGAPNTLKNRIHQLAVNSGDFSGYCAEAASVSTLIPGNQHAILTRELNKKANFLYQLPYADDIFQQPDASPVFTFTAILPDHIYNGETITIEWEGVSLTKEYPAGNPPINGEGWGYSWEGFDRIALGWVAAAASPSGSGLTADQLGNAMMFGWSNVNGDLYSAVRLVITRKNSIGTTTHHSDSVMISTSHY